MLKQILLFCLVGIISFSISFYTVSKIKANQDDEGQFADIFEQDALNCINRDSCSILPIDTLKFDCYKSKSIILLLPRKNGAFYTWKLDTTKSKVFADKIRRDTLEIGGEVRNYQEFSFINQADLTDDHLKLFLVPRFMAGQDPIDSLFVNF